MARAASCESSDWRVATAAKEWWEWREWKAGVMGVRVVRKVRVVRMVGSIQWKR